MDKLDKFPLFLSLPISIQKNIYCFLPPWNLIKTCIYISKKTLLQIQEIFNRLFSIFEKKFPVITTSLQKRKWSNPRIVCYIFGYLSRKRPIKHLIETASSSYFFDIEINFWSSVLYSIKKFRQLHSINTISLSNIWPNDEKEHRQLAEYFFFHAPLLKSEKRLLTIKTKKKSFKFKQKKNLYSTIFDIKILNLSCEAEELPMFKLPEEIIYFDQLDTVFLRNNSFTSFPITLCYLPHLRYLHLDHCGLKKIPEGIVLFNLTTLSLAHNELCSLPISLQKSFALKVLDISSNCLTSLEIKKLLLKENKKLAFPGLQLLFLSNNMMTEEEKGLLIKKIQKKKISLQIH